MNHFVWYPDVDNSLSRSNAMRSIFLEWLKSNNTNSQIVGSHPCQKGWVFKVSLSISTNNVQWNIGGYRLERTNPNVKNEFIMYYPIKMPLCNWISRIIKILLLLGLFFFCLLMQHLNNPKKYHF